MPKYRKLPVETLESEELYEMPNMATRTMWLLMPLVLCREGRGRDLPSWLKARVFPLFKDSEITEAFIGEAMDWFEARGLIVRYQVDGRRYFFVTTFHNTQGNTTKEAESIYPPPPEPDPTGPIPEKVRTDSGETPDLVRRASGAGEEPVTPHSRPDAVCNMQTTDADPHRAEPSPDGEPAETAAVPSTFSEWQERILSSKNRIAILRRMCEVLYPGLDPPEYGYIGRVARTVGGAGRLADLLWQHSTRPPTGDLLAYIQAVAKGNGNGRQQSPEAAQEVPLATGWVNDD